MCVLIVRIPRRFCSWEQEIFLFNPFAEDMIVYTIQGPFFFGAAEKIEHALGKIVDNQPDSEI